MVAGVCGVGGFASAAGASTVSLVPATDPAQTVLEYAGDLDEANDLEVTGPLDGFARLADGVVIVPTMPCQPTNNDGAPVNGPRRFARCPFGTIVSLHLSGGGGVDRLRTQIELPAAIDGGPDGDLLVGGDAADALDGGDGGDELRGRGGRDLLVPGPGADIVQGGGGRDRVDYRDSEAGVNVDFDVVPDDGAPGEGDLVTDDVEDVLGSGFADTLTGSPDANRLEGRGGADTLDGGPGQDELDGGPGADTIRADDQAVDLVACGGGMDTVTADQQDTVDADCEFVTRVQPPLPDPLPTPDPPAPPSPPAPPAPTPTQPSAPTPRSPSAPRDTAAPRAALSVAPRLTVRSLRRGRSALRVRCSETCAASVQVEVTRRTARALGLESRVVATGVRTRASSARRAVLRLRMTREARRAVAGRRTLLVALRVRVEDEAGNGRRLTQRMQLPRG